MSEQIALTLAGGNGQYDLARAPLGGGQTALVYKATVRNSSVAARIGQTCAIKLMIPGLDRETERRFWNEEDYLLGLNSALKQMALPALGRKSGEGLVPQIWDQGVDSGRGFLVMTLAEGKPLDDLLRSQEALSEMDALTLIYQLLAVFRALHEELRRGYHDFQPRNIFWREETRTITVIDWNLLSPEQEAGQKSPLYVQDRRIVLGLLYRLIVGVELPGPSPMQMAAPAGWTKLSPLTRLLLRELLAPAIVDSLSTQALYERIGEALQRQRQSADELLLAAASQYDLVKELQGRPEQADVLTRIRLTQEASALLSLAEAKGISPRMGPIAQELRQNLGQESPSRAHLSSGLSFLGAGDRALAREFFAKAVTEATLPDDQLMAWRWWLLTRAIPAQEKVEPLLGQLKPLLITESGRPAQGEIDRGQLVQIEWPGLDQLVREMEIGQILQDLLHLDVRTLDEDPLKDWYIKSGEALGVAPQADSTQTEAKTLDLQALSGEAYRVEGNSYADCLWMVLAQACGLRDATAAQQAVVQQRSALMERVSQLDKLKRELGALDLGKALDMIAGRKTIDPYERTLHQQILQRIPDWFDGTASDPSAHDQDLRNLFSELENRGVEGKEVKPFRRLLGLFETTTYWTRNVIPAHKETEQAEPSPEQGTPQSIAPELALEYALSFLKEIEESAKEIEAKRKPPGGKAEESKKDLTVAQKRREKLVDAFVDQCLRIHYISPLIEEWMEVHYPDQLKVLASRLDYQKKVKEHRQTLEELDQEIQKAKKSLNDQIQAQEREALRAAAAAEQAKATLEKDLTQQRQKHEAEQEKTRAEKERTIAGLDASIEEKQTRFNKLEEEFKQEKARRELTLDRQLADKQQALDELAAEYARQKQALDSSLQSLQETLRQKREEHTKLDSLVNNLRSQKRQLESDLNDQRRLEEAARNNRTLYEGDVQKAEQKLQKAQTDGRSMEAKLNRLATEVKQLEQQRDALKQQSSQRSSGPSRIVGNPGANISVSNHNLPLFDQPDPQTVFQINNLLAAANDIRKSMHDSRPIQVRLADKLYAQACSISDLFPKISTPTIAIKQVATLYHIYHTLDYLLSANKDNKDNDKDIERYMSDVGAKWQDAEDMFRKRWVKE